MFTHLKKRIQKRIRKEKYQKEKQCVVYEQNENHIYIQKEKRDIFETQTAHY